jgi:hypothetical protein
MVPFVSVIKIPSAAWSTAVSKPVRSILSLAQPTFTSVEDRPHSFYRQVCSDCSAAIADFGTVRLIAKAAPQLDRSDFSNPFTRCSCIRYGVSATGRAKQRFLQVEKSGTRCEKGR